MESFKFTLVSDCVKEFNDARSQLHSNVIKALVDTTTGEESNNAEDEAAIEDAIARVWNGDSSGPEKHNDTSVIEIISDGEDCEDIPLAERLNQPSSSDQGRSNRRKTRSQTRRGRGRGGRRTRGRNRMDLSSDLGESSGNLIVIDDVESPSVGNISETIFIDDDDDEEEVVAVGNKEVVTVGDEDDVEIIEDVADISALEKDLDKDLDMSLFNYSEINVKIFWRGLSLIKVPLRRYQKFGAVFKHLAETQNVQEENIVLVLRDEIIIRPDDSPDSLKLTVADVIDGGIGSSQVVNTMKDNSSQREPLVDKDALQFKLLFKDRKKPLMISIKKTDQMRVLMIKCAEELEVPLATLKFMLDGEELEENATPSDLDLEGEEAFDVIRK